MDTTITDVDNKIVLSSAPIREESLPALIQHYDPTVRFASRNKLDAKGLPTFSIRSIIADFNKDYDLVRQITLPVLLFTKRRKLSTEATVHPSVWETRDVHVSTNTGWAVLFGDRNGQRMRNYSVLQVRYPSQKEIVFQNGKRVLFTCLQGVLMTFVNVEQYRETYFTYRVDTILEWPRACTIYQPPADECKVAAANLTLVAVSIRDKLKSTEEEWNDQSLTAEQLAGIDMMRACAYEAVVKPELTPRYMEHFISVNPNTRNPFNHSVPDGEDVNIFKTTPEAFMATVHHKMSEYRHALLLADHEDKNNLIPINATYTIVNEDDSPVRVVITLEVPSIIESFHHFSIEAEFSDIPQSLSVEPGLTYATSNFYDFLSLVTQDGTHKHFLART